MSPERWVLDGSLYRDTSERLRVVMGGTESTCGRQLGTPQAPPPYFDDCCRRHFLALQLRRPQTQWEDVAPLYALTAAIHRQSNATLPSSCAKILEPLYESLRGDSRLEWLQAKSLIEDMWAQLTVLHGGTRR